MSLTRWRRRELFQIWVRSSKAWISVIAPLIKRFDPGKCEKKSAIAALVDQGENALKNQNS
jgi:hypothetical protein